MLKTMMSGEMHYKHGRCNLAIRNVVCEGLCDNKSFLGVFYSPKYTQCTWRWLSYFRLLLWWIRHCIFFITMFKLSILSKNYIQLMFCKVKSNSFNVVMYLDQKYGPNHQYLLQYSMIHEFKKLKPYLSHFLFLP